MPRILKEMFTWWNLSTLPFGTEIIHFNCYREFFFIFEVPGYLFDSFCSYLFFSPSSPHLIHTDFHCLCIKRKAGELWIYRDDESDSFEDLSFELMICLLPAVWVFQINPSCIWAARESGGKLVVKI